jgi:hypothetical protein
MRDFWFRAVGLSILFIILAVGIAINSYRSPFASDPNFTLIAVGTEVVFLGLMSTPIIRGYRRQIKHIKLPAVEVGLGIIAKPGEFAPRIEIRRREVTSIEETEEGLRVRANNPNRIIVVPAGLEETDYRAVRTQLATWARIKS